MSNYIYNKAKERFLGKQLDWGVGTGGDTFKVLLLTSAYVPSPNHSSLSDIPLATRIGVSAPLAGKNITDGVASANPATFTDLPLGNSIRYLVIFKQNGIGQTLEIEANSYLIAFIDTADGITSGLAVTQPNATIEWALDSTLTSPNNKRLVFKL